MRLPVVLPALLLLGMSAALPAEELVDADFSPWTDGQGMLWDISNDGQVQDGTNDCFDGAMRVNLPGRGWNIEHQQEVQGGHEFVIGGKLGNVELVRRIRLDEARGWVRYLEVLTNPTAKPVTLSFEVWTNLGGNPQGVFGVDGKQLATGKLAKDNLGLASVQQPGQRPSVIWLVGDGQGTVVPTISTQSGARQIKVTWPVTVPANGSVTLMHLMAQRATLLPQQIGDAIRPVWRRRLIKPLLPDGSEPANWKLGEADAGGGLPVVEALAEEHGITERDADTVVLDAGEGARMRGQLAGGPLQISTRLGNGAVAVDALAATVAVEGALRLFLRDGEVLVADPATPVQGTVELASAEGVRLPVDPTRAPLVLLRRQPTDGQATGASGFVRLVDGTRAAIGGTLPNLPLLTTWGAVEVPLAAVARITRQREPRPAWRVELTDGSRVTAVPGAATVTLPTLRYGARPVPLALVAGYDQARADGGGSPADDDGPVAPDWRGFVLDGGQRLAGGFAEAQLSLTVNGVATAVPTVHIHACKREGEGLTVTMDDGATIVGTLAGPLAVKGGALAWKIPGALVRNWADGVAKPAAPPAAPPAGAAGEAGEKEAAP